jgi:hypothetical protein
MEEIGRDVSAAGGVCGGVKANIFLPPFFYQIMGRKMGVEK